jgi:hypothetical protein
LDLSGLEQGPGLCCCELGNKSLGFINGREFWDYVSNCYLRKKDSPQEVSSGVRLPHEVLKPSCVETLSNR